MSDTYILRASEVTLVERFMKTRIAIGFRRRILDSRGRARLLLLLFGNAVILVARCGFWRKLRLIDEGPPFAIERGRKAR